MPVALPRSAWSSRRGVVPFIAARTLSALLSGCGPAETDLQQAIARQLQSRVMRVSEAAAAGDRDAALKALDVLAVDLETSAGKGEVSADRKRRISTVIAAVRADLTGTQVAVQSADIRPVAPATAIAGPNAAPHQESAPGEVAPVAPPAADPAPAPADPAPVYIPPPPAPMAPDTSTNNNGKGNDNGNDGKAKGRNN
jgi:hypothetical protein